MAFGPARSRLGQRTCGITYFAPMAYSQFSSPTSRVSGMRYRIDPSSSSVMYCTKLQMSMAVCCPDKLETSVNFDIRYHHAFTSRQLSGLGQIISCMDNLLPGWRIRPQVHGSPSVTSMMDDAVFLFIHPSRLAYAGSFSVKKRLKADIGVTRLPFRGVAAPALIAPAD